MIAMNFQTNGVAMQLNDAMFEENGRCGYVRKPDTMCIPDSKFSVYNADYLVANKIEISIISAQCLTLLTGEPTWTRVMVDLYDLPKDTVRGKHYTELAITNGLNTIYPPNKLVFEKVIKPLHAMLYIRVVKAESNLNERKSRETTNKKANERQPAKEEKTPVPIAHRILPVHNLTQGYRHITMRTEGNKPIGPVSIFVKINVQTYLPEAHVVARRQFTDPIKTKLENDRQRLGFMDPWGSRKNSMNQNNNDNNEEINYDSNSYLSTY